MTLILIFIIIKSNFLIIIYNNNNTSAEINYETSSVVRGEFKITYHNFNQAIISGTFWYDAINSNGEVVKVREGRFDMRY